MKKKIKTRRGIACEGSRVRIVSPAKFFFKNLDFFNGFYVGFDEFFDSIVSFPQFSLFSSLFSPFFSPFSRKKVKKTAKKSVICGIRGALYTGQNTGKSKEKAKDL